jgi:hypothetical protein
VLDGRLLIGRGAALLQVAPHRGVVERSRRRGREQHGYVDARECSRRREDRGDHDPEQGHPAQPHQPLEPLEREAHLGLGGHAHGAW